MNARQNWVLAAAVVLASLILGFSFGGRSAAQPKADGPAARYQTVLGFSRSDYFVVVDTVSGECWQHHVGAGAKDEWTDLGVPPRAQK